MAGLYCRIALKRMRRLMMPRINMALPRELFWMRASSELRCFDCFRRSATKLGLQQCLDDELTDLRLFRSLRSSRIYRLDPMLYQKSRYLLCGWPNRRHVVGLPRGLSESHTFHSVRRQQKGKAAGDCRTPKPGGISCD